MAIHRSDHKNVGCRRTKRVLSISSVMLVGILLGRLLCCRLVDQSFSSHLSSGFFQGAQSLFLRKKQDIIGGDSNSLDFLRKDIHNENWTPDVIFGNYSMPITIDTKKTNSSDIQKAFDVGLVESYGFCFFEARKTVQTLLQELEDQEDHVFCPMCYWLLAMGHSPYINHPLIEKEPDFKSASEAAALAFQQAHRSKDPRLSTKEMGLIDAISVRFSSSFENQTTGYVLYSDKLRDLHEQILDDTNGIGDADVMAFLADSIMVLHADSNGYNFYDEKTFQPKPEIAYAISLLEDCLDISPNHPLCQHLYIHITEPSHKMAYFSGPVADNLLAITSSNDAQHLQHMPSHSYLRIGRYHDAVLSNVMAHASDQRYEDHGAVAYAVAHDLVVLLCAAALSGELSVALEYSNSLRDVYKQHPNRRDGPGTEIGWHVWRTLRLQFGDFAQVLQDSDWIPSNTESLANSTISWPYAVVLGHYSKGVASLWNKDPSWDTKERLSKANDHLKKLREASIFVDSSLQGMVSVADYSLDASIKFYEIQNDTTQDGIGQYHNKNSNFEPVLQLFQSARAEQDSWTYTEPPLWYTNLKLCEGTLLRIMGQHNEALHIFETELIDWPENRFALYGLWRVLKEEGANIEKITDIKDRFDQSSIWADESVKNDPPMVCIELGE